MIGGLVALALLLGVSDVAAEPATGLPRVGILMCCAPEQPLGANSAALVQGLHEAGYVNGKSVVLEWRYAGNIE